MHRWAAINGRTDSIIEYVMLCAVTSHCKLYCRYSSTGESTSSTGVLTATLAVVVQVALYRESTVAAAVHAVAVAAQRCTAVRHCCT
eukprot:13978-Heterococcus_DN1.PRE.2